MTLLEAPTLLLGKCSRASFKLSQESLCSIQISFVGAKASGSSSVAVVTSIVSGCEVRWYVNEVPHLPQKVRTTSGDE